MSKRITGLIAIAALSAFVAACDGGANNTNNAGTNNRNVNLASPTPTLSGNTNTNTNTETARRVPTREEYERDRERYQREARESGRTVGSGVNDGWLWVKTRFDLAAADDLRDSTINVDVDNAVVTLTGTVASAAQKTRAEQVAKSVEDVRSVRNQLRVVSDNANANTNANTNARRPNANR
ncbi:MAG TPA: BON domain-containing protein [Pyrinomonadaceae bacterium]|nr:BON domain-containing protein [Pyrinomonadaceae bacterium]